MVLVRDAVPTSRETRFLCRPSGESTAWNSWWEGLHLILLLTTNMAVKLDGKPLWIHVSHVADEGDSGTI